MTLAQLFKRIVPYVKPHRFLLLATLSLTLLGSLLAQVNAVVLDRTVDAINALVGSPDFTWAKAAMPAKTITAASRRHLKAFLISYRKLCVFLYLRR